MAATFAIPAFIVGAYGPDELRIYAIIGFMGLIIMGQVIFMWANRSMITPYSRAQQHYLKGDFKEARNELETLQAAGRADFMAMTLLGNVYRQLGFLEKSEAVLYEAVNIQPEHYFPLYGFGRTLLSMGRYKEAAEAIQQALAQGAAAVVRFDLGEALFRDGQVQEAVEQFQSVLAPGIDPEPHRIMLAMYFSHRAGRGPAPEPALIRKGLPYWENIARILDGTPYADALKQDITDLLALI